MEDVMNKSIIDPKLDLDKQATECADQELKDKFKALVEQNTSLKKKADFAKMKENTNTNYIEVLTGELLESSDRCQFGEKEYNDLQ